MKGTLILVVNQCVLNQSWCYQLLFDVISIAITMCCTMGNMNLDATNVMHVHYFSLWDLNLNICFYRFLQLLFIFIFYCLILIVGWRFWLQAYAFSHRMITKFIGVVEAFLAFASSLQPQNVDNILVFMLDPWFKSLQLIHGYVGLESLMFVLQHSMIVKCRCLYYWLFKKVITNCY
jgi:hypothetical protein